MDSSDSEESGASSPAQNHQNSPAQNIGQEDNPGQNLPVQHMNINMAQDHAPGAQQLPPALDQQMPQPPERQMQEQQIYPPPELPPMQQQAMQDQFLQPGGRYTPPTRHQSLERQIERPGIPPLRRQNNMGGEAWHHQVYPEQAWPQFYGERRPDYPPHHQEISPPRAQEPREQQRNGAHQKPQGMFQSLGMADLPHRMNMPEQRQDRYGGTNSWRPEYTQNQQNSQQQCQQNYQVPDTGSSRQPREPTRRQGRQYGSKEDKDKTSTFMWNRCLPMGSSHPPASALSDSNTEAPSMIGAPMDRESNGKKKPMVMPDYVTASAASINRQRNEAAQRINHLPIGRSSALKYMKIQQGKILEIRTRMEDSIREIFYGEAQERQKERFHHAVRELCNAVEITDDIFTLNLLTFDSKFDVVVEAASVDTRNVLTGKRLKIYNDVKKVDIFIRV